MDYIGASKVLRGAISTVFKMLEGPQSKCNNPRRGNTFGRHWGILA
jgi:hypothetical protein